MTNAQDIKKLLTTTAKSAKITRLVAEENIDVEYSDTATTACFVPDTRTIVYPYSMILEDDDIHMLFIFHEVGHVLFSRNEKLLDESIAGNFQSLFNITEDIRIERLIKHKYPGIVKNFHSGYSKLLDKGFFGDAQEIAFLNFPNRLNIYAKLGPVTGRFIKFSQEETEFYNRCIAAQTEEEAFLLAKELHSMHENIFTRMMDIIKDDITGSAKNTIKDLLDKMIFPTFGVDDDSVNIGMGEDQNTEMSEENLERLAEMLDKRDSVKTFDRALEESSIRNCVVYSYKEYTKDNINYVSWKTFYEHLTIDCKISHDKASMQTTRKFRDSCKVALDSMVREFEAKKAAYRQKYAKITNTGRIDVNRLVNYKFDDQIFSRQITIADAKNHGFVILLDCSGSIHRQFNSMAEQVIVLTEFFRKIGVKYRVFGYGASLSGRLFDKRIMGNAVKQNAVYNGFLSYGSSTLIEFLSSDMNSGEHSIVCHGLLNKYGFGFGGTPTIDALQQMEVLANEFFVNNRIQKKKLINITDGDPTDMNRGFEYDMNDNSRNYGRMTLVVDPITKKNHLIHKCGFSAAHAIACVFKDRYDIDTYNIGLGSLTMLRSFIGRSAKDSETKQRAKLNYTEVDTEYKSKVFIAPASHVRNNYSMAGVQVDSDSTISKVAREFNKIITRNNKSKNFLNILAKYLSE